MIREIAESKRSGNLKPKANGSHGVSLERLVAHASDNSRRVGIESTLGTVVEQRDGDMDIQAPVGEGALEGAEVDLLLLLSLHGVVKEDTGLKNVELTLGEHSAAGEEGRARVAERIGEAEAVNEAAQDGEAAHESEEVKPAGLAAGALHVQDAVGEQLGAGLADLVAKVKDHDALGRLGAGVPGRHGPETAGNETRFGDAEEETGDDEGGIIVLPCLEGRDDAEEEQLEGQPFTRPDTVQAHVGGDFGEHDAQRQHLLADVELVLRDADILEEGAGDGVGNVSTVKF